MDNLEATLEDISLCNYQNALSAIEATLDDIDKSNSISHNQKEELVAFFREKIKEF